MPHAFYLAPDYRKKQSLIAKHNWKKGLYSHLNKPEKFRRCKNPNCNNSFSLKPDYRKIFCSSSCAASFNNLGRIHSSETKKRISEAISKLPHQFFSRGRGPRLELICLACKDTFYVAPYLGNKRKYCSNFCAIKTIGSRTTSPKASKGKSGVRKDIDRHICFYSTWEANIARVFSLVDLKWSYAPRIFDLGEHHYRPDFYLLEHNTFIEVKNFLGEYSLKRDNLFREKYPEVRLDLILKKDYLDIKSNYKDFIENWEE